jgi:hypothetical protein
MTRRECSIVVPHEPAAMAPTPSAQPRLSLDGFHDYSIVVLRRGGLGNQLFQHAATLGVSMTTGGTVVYARSDETIHSHAVQLHAVQLHAVQLEDFVGTVPRVISKSTFTWWAAVVGDSMKPSGTRQVCCPAFSPEQFPLPAQNGRLSLPVPSSPRMLS